MASASARCARSARELALERPFQGSIIRPAALGLVAAFLVAACRGQQTTSSVDLVLPEGVGRRVELAPKAAFAEYVELPELRHELRVTLASYETSCRSYVPPGPTDALFVVTVVWPPAEPPHPGIYALEVARKPDAGAPIRSGAYAVARQGDHGFDFPPGGSIDLRAVDLSPAGRVSGVLALEFPGDGNRPAAGAHGKFEARMCQSR